MVFQEPTFQVTPPVINLPKGGRAIRGTGEKFAANQVIRHRLSGLVFTFDRCARWPMRSVG